MCFAPPAAPTPAPVQLPPQVKPLSTEELTPPKVNAPEPEKTATYLGSSRVSKIAPAAAKQSTSFNSLRIRPNSRSRYMGLNVPNA